MDLSDEVCLKIKSAIKARLKELGIVWDRELPDYVMVLIKNKKTKEQMESDLNIFLGDHTLGFTDWLCDVCDKLETCGVTSKVLKTKDEEKKLKVKRRTSDESQLESKKSRTDEGTQFKFDSDSEDSLLPSQCLSEKSPERVEKENGHAVEGEGEEEEEMGKGRGGGRPTEKDCHQPAAAERQRIQIEWERRSSGEEMESRRRRSRRRERRGSSTSRPKSRSKSGGRSRSDSRPKEAGDGGGGVSVLRRGTAPSGGRRRKEEQREERSGEARSGERRPPRDARDILRGRTSRKNGYTSRSSRKEEEDRNSITQCRDPVEDKLPSLVKVTPRPVRPLSMQPPPNLILKAVAEAQKSIAITTLPQPEDKLAQKENNKKPIRKKPIYKKRRAHEFEPISITLLNDRVTSDMPLRPEADEMCRTVAERKETPPPPAIPEVQRFTISLQSDDDSLIGSDHEEYEENGGEEIVEVTTVEEELSSALALPELTEAEPMDTDVRDQLLEEPAPPSPVYRFDRSRLGPRIAPVVPDAETVLSCLAPGCQITKTIMNENAFSESSETKSEENDKLIKCKFWPSCEAGDACRFYHPKTYCRALPNCKFGGKCLYIHPPCKFGEQCLNVSCPYTHSSSQTSSTAGTTPPATGKVWTKVPLAPSNGQICMFFPNCTKPFCPYQHYAAPGIGIPCKYGGSCTKLSCEFDHPGTSKNPYKWVAGSQD